MSGLKTWHQVPSRESGTAMIQVNGKNLSKNTGENWRERGNPITARSRVKQGNITFVFSSKEEKVNNASALKEYIEKCFHSGKLSIQ